MMMQRITSKCPRPLESGRFGLRQGKYNEKRETRSSPESIFKSVCITYNGLSLYDGDNADSKIRKGLAISSMRTS
ncbi:unnamed protein product [Rhizophagus irregularis]|uniref:Uncharacterized protein n=1 Tax=Rhizophagus irregularis TaxID=588596 RepID=A0A915ZLZ6_9GLOM|nr:unnamed protein product [Rhizophagus irregularis]CAB5379622.1 unnamed protein product [Rhizophagus irregularis]